VFSRRMEQMRRLGSCSASASREPRSSSSSQSNLAAWLRLKRVEVHHWARELTALGHEVRQIPPVNEDRAKGHARLHEKALIRNGSPEAITTDDYAPTEQRWTSWAIAISRRSPGMLTIGCKAVACLLKQTLD
jgi:hypothetical protein